MDMESFERAVSGYNNFLEVESGVAMDCEMVVLGFNPYSSGGGGDGGGGDDEQDNFECHGGLAFQASECLAYSSLYGKGRF